MKEVDILARQSRPQRHSTWIPKTRDWRYATGVFQHDDFEDAPNDRSAWDTMDYDYQVGGNAKGLSRSRTGSGSELGMDEPPAALGTPCSGRSKEATESPKAVIRTKAAKKVMSLRKNEWASIAKYKSNGQANDTDAQSGYEAFSLTVRLRFTGPKVAEMQRVLNETSPHPPTPLSGTRTQSSGTPRTLKSPFSPDTPASGRTAATINSPHILDSIGSIRTFPLFQRSWVNETQDFNMRTIRSTLRDPSEKVEHLGIRYHWYADAVPVDAIFPPGVPLSAKEINAYYPHHVRWKGVMLRLTNNDYRGADIMGMQTFFRGPPNPAITPPLMNLFQRDTVKATIPNFKISGYKGKPDHNLFTADLALGKYLDDACRSFTLPSFDDLLRGLHHLPIGLDARGLTQCLVWYLSFRDSFTPRLDLNVLHTQALIRALRQPLRPFGPQNLDRNALQEWREKGGFEKVIVQYEESKSQQTPEGEQQRRTQLHMNLDDDSVKLNLTLPLRHVLTFPFLALHRVAGEALKMGIEKAETRQAKREKKERRQAREARGTAKLTKSDETGSQDKEHEKHEDVKLVEQQHDEDSTKKKPYRIPKRPRPAEKDEPTPLSTPADPRILFGPRIPSGSHDKPLTTSSYEYARQSLLPSGANHFSRTWNTPAPSSAYRQLQPAHDTTYARRDYQSRSSAHQYGVAYPSGQPGARDRDHHQGSRYRSGPRDGRYDGGYR